MLDRRMNWERIGCLRAGDHQAGAYATPVAEAYQRYFAQQSRFRLVELRRFEALLRASPTQGRAPIDYSSLIQDSEVLGQIARQAKLDTLVRTQIQEIGDHREVRLDWFERISDQPLARIASVRFDLPQLGYATPIDPAVLDERLGQALDALWREVPFLGRITGRDDSLITLDLGRQDGVKLGDQFLVGTIQNVEVHPKLRTLVNWKMENVGLIQVDQTEAHLSFAHIVREDNPANPLAAPQKLLRKLGTFTAPLRDTPIPAPTPLEPIEERARFGSIHLSALGGRYARDLSRGIPETAGNSWSGGIQGGVQLWLTRAWYTEVQLRFFNGTYNQTNLENGMPSPATQLGGVNQTLYGVIVTGGYTHHLSADPLGTRASVRVGYRSTQTNLPLSTLESTAPMSLNSFFVGLGGAFAVGDHWGFLTTIDFRLFSVVRQAFEPTPQTGITDVEFNLGAYWHLDPRLELRFGLGVLAQGVDFGEQANFTQKLVTLGPTLLYYF